MQKIGNAESFFANHIPLSSTAVAVEIGLRRCIRGADAAMGDDAASSLQTGCLHVVLLLKHSMSTVQTVPRSHTIAHFRHSDAVQQRLVRVG